MTVVQHMQPAQQGQNPDRRRRTGGARFAGKWFASEGYTATAADSAREALEAIQQTEYDLALLDIKMPGMDGMELQERLREADPDLTVVIMTGYASGGDRRAGAEAGRLRLHHQAGGSRRAVAPGGQRAGAQARTSGEVVRLRENCRRSIPGTELIGKSPAMKRGHRADRDGGAHRRHGADHRRERHRQGSGGARHPRRQPAALHADGDHPLRRAHRDAARKRTVRPRAGAFTGAQYRKKGKFEVADGGTCSSTRSATSA